VEKIIREACDRGCGIQRVKHPDRRLFQFVSLPNFRGNRNVETALLVACLDNGCKPVADIGTVAG